MVTRLSSSDREKLYDAEALKAKESGRGELPICNICDMPVDGHRQAWDASHDPTKPRWLGGSITGIAHRRCNRRHNNTHDTPRFAKSNRQRRMAIGATVSSSRPIVGTYASNIKLPMRHRARPINRTTGQEM